VCVRAIAGCQQATQIAAFFRVCSHGDDSAVAGNS
jgi:hypothetical protein